MSRRYANVPRDKRIRVEKNLYWRNGRYETQIRDPGGRQHWASFVTAKEARDWRARAQVDPVSLASGKRTLQEVWTTFLEHQGSSLKPTTRAGWEQQWRAHIGPAFSGWPVRKITVWSIKDFLSRLEINSVGAATRAKCRAILHRLLEEAVENGQIPSSPAAARGTRVKRQQAKKARILSPPELAAVLRAADRVATSSDALAIEALFSLGLRLGEMAGLQVKDLDSARREIRVERTVVEVTGRLIVQDSIKTGQARVLRVPSDLPVWPKLITHVKREALIGEAHVFRTSTGQVLRLNNWRKRVWEPVMIAAAIDDPPTPHSGRRTTARFLSALGVPPATIQAILRHSTLAQTGEYIDVPLQERETALARLVSLYANLPKDGV